MIIWVNGVLRETDVCDWRHGSHLQHRLSKRQSQTTVLLRTSVTQMIIFNQGMYMLLLGFKLFSILYQIGTKFLFESNNLLLIHKPQFFPYTLQALPELSDSNSFLYRVYGDIHEPQIAFFYCLCPPWTVNKFYERPYRSPAHIVFSTNSKG